MRSSAAARWRPYGEVAEVALDPVAFYVEIVGLRGCKHLVPMVDVVVPLLHCFGQLGQHLAMAVGCDCLQTLDLRLHLIERRFSDQAGQLAPSGASRILLGRLALI